MNLKNEILKITKEEYPDIEIRELENQSVEAHLNGLNRLTAEELLRTCNEEEKIEVRDFMLQLKEGGL